ncbi:HAMP domain-containing methyl-accepting chemotaxis protein [Silvanigrella aquatica]|uniref:Methyl-accepting transducer domain-containing protein n=1 Tax=Silvanigrella aquatica TaxID=1915309 RepID=A0A1L4D0F9_9BACT|nr:methyl-accepting chemotaxis protein [Silvanigrella aquatica]APJ03679.1 hypothetical protein AXG55_07080 [Silvanigrella aquatica]
MSNKNFSLKKWFLLLMIVVLSNILILGTFSVFSSFISNGYINNLGNNFFPLMKNTLLVDMVHDGLRGNVTDALLLTLTNAPQSEKDEVLKENQEIIKKFKEYIENIEKLPLKDDIKDSIKEVIPIINKYLETSTLVIKYSFSNNKKEASLQQENFTKIFKKLESELEKISSKIEKETDIEILNSNSISGKLKTISIILMILFASISMIFSYYIISKIYKMINQIIDDLFLQSNSILKRAVEIKSISQDLSSSTIQQNESLQKTSAAVLEINSMIKKTSEGSEQSTKMSKNSEIAVKNGEKIVFQLINCIKKIKNSNSEIISQVDHGNKKIKEIIKLISEISAKTSVINDIVFQTKLLSFNASVESARAGEHGKGFSVVAEEIGNLAKISGEAAKDINLMLADSIDRVEKIIFETTSEVDKSFKIGNENIEESNQIANNCAVVMKETVENVILVNKSVIDISLATKEQEYGISEIVSAINDLEKTTNNNLNISTISAESGVDLNIKANEITKIIDTLSYMINGNSYKNSN